LAVAVTETTWPLFCQLVPEGLTVPPAVGLAAVVRLYWVINVAVKVVAEAGTVTLWLWAPASLQEAKRY
jgi:hypothetical protein